MYNLTNKTVANRWLGFMVSGLLFLTVGCSPEQTDEAVIKPKVLPKITVAEVLYQRVTEWDEFTGRLQAPQTVDLRPRISGYIESIDFHEGSIVEAGTVLFTIDNRPFKAEVKRLAAQLTRASSQLDLAQKEYRRGQDLAQKKVMSAELLDNREAALQQAKADVESVSAQLDVAQLNLSYTEIEAPINGRVSNALITKGNYVNAGQSILTTLVSIKEIYAYFDADEQTYLKYNRLAKEGRRPSARDVATPAYMALASDHDYPYEGVVDFVDNKMNTETGTIRGRAVFNNPDGSLIPGLFARIKVIGSGSYNGILITDKAIGTDLNNKFVLVLDHENKVQYRKVEVGEKLQGLRIVKSGLVAGDKVVVNGLQRVRPGTLVDADIVNMAPDHVLVQLQDQQLRIDHSREQGQLAGNTRSLAENLLHEPVVK